jgi:hypothetical protein
MMGKMRALILLVAVAGVAGLVHVRAQTKGESNSALTAQDRAEIQELVASYAKALGTCAAEEYADLFAPGAYFGSGIRGAVAGRDRLIALVQSERHCNSNATPNNGANGAPARRPLNVPMVVVESSAEGVTGRASLGNAGHYEDVYVKTPKGWRFKSRDVITPQEEAANISAKDVRAIRQLAGNDRGEYEDVWVSAPEGKRFRSSGVVTAVSGNAVKGTAHLKGDGGHYEDLYVRTADGWRFQSRAYVPAAAAGTGAVSGTTTSAGAR